MNTVLDEHIGYLEDTARLALYRQAIRAAINDGDVVADVGCGTAVLGLMCLQQGAGHVHAIDSSGALEVARKSLQLAGWGEKASFLRDLSYRVELPSQVDAVICDHVGYFGFDYGLIELLADAKKRFLKPGGKLLPQRLKLTLGAVDSPNSWKIVDAWRDAQIPQEFHWVTDLGVNNKYAVTLHSREVVTTTQEIADLKLGESHPPYFAWNASLKALRDGTVHGLAGWFECELTDDVWMTNSPLSAGAIDRHQAFLPIDAPFSVRSGDTLLAKVMVRPTDNLIAWELAHPASGRKFSQTTWQGDMLEAAVLKRKHPDHKPVPTSSARNRALVLGYCDGQRTAAQVLAEVIKHHPALLPSTEEIARFVAATLDGSTS